MTTGLTAVQGGQVMSLTRKGAGSSSRCSPDMWDPQPPGQTNRLAPAACMCRGPSIPTEVHGTGTNVQGLRWNEQGLPSPNQRSILFQCRFLDLLSWLRGGWSFMASLSHCCAVLPLDAMQDLLDRSRHALSEEHAARFHHEDSPFRPCSPIG